MENIANKIDKKLVLSKKEFISIFEIIYACDDGKNLLTKDKPMLQYLHIERDIAETCDGYRLSRRKLPIVLDKKYLLHRKDIKEVLKQVRKSKENINVIFNEDNVEINNNEFNIIVKSNNELNFLNLNSLIDSDLDELKNKFILIKKDFKELMKGLQKIGFLKFYSSDNDEIIFEYFNIDKEYKEEKVISCDNIKGNLELTAINGKFLKPVLNSYKDSEKIFLFNNKNVQPLYFTNEKRTKLDVILPIRINKLIDIKG